MSLTRSHTRRFGFATAVVAPMLLMAPASATHLPDVLNLPDGFQPEGIAISGKTAYLGSLADGDIYALNLLTGKGKTIVEGDGDPSVGMKIIGNRLYVAGGPSGTLSVIDVRTRKVVTEYSLADSPAFINDVAVLGRYVYATNSQAAEIYRVPISIRPDAVTPETIQLTGDFQLAQGFNLNGITQTPDRSALLAVQSATSTLFRIDPATGSTEAVDLGGYQLTNGDGLLTKGRTVYVVQNRLNKVAVLRMSPDGRTGTFVKAITDSDFDVPTTTARFAGSLYLPNARFGTAGEQPATYQVVRVPAK